MIKRLQLFLGTAILWETVLCAHNRDILCNDKTLFACVCRVGDDSLLQKNYKPCYQLISSSNLSVVSIHMDIQTEWREPLFHGEEYGLWFKKKLSSWTTKRCKQNLNLCANTTLEIKRQNVITLTVDPLNDGTTIVMLAVLKNGRQTTLTPDSTTEPQLIVNVLRHYNKTFSALVGGGRIFDISIKLLTPDGPPGWLKITGTMIALILLVIVLIIIYIIAIIKAVKDRRAALERAQARERAKALEQQAQPNADGESKPGRTKALLDEGRQNAEIIFGHQNYQTMEEPPMFQTCAAPDVDFAIDIISKPLPPPPLKLPKSLTIQALRMWQSAFGSYEKLSSMPRSATIQVTLPATPSPATARRVQHQPQLGQTGPPLTGGTPLSTEAILGARRSTFTRSSPAECSFASTSSFHEEPDAMNESQQSFETLPVTFTHVSNPQQNDWGDSGMATPKSVSTDSHGFNIARGTVSNNELKYEPEQLNNVSRPPRAAADKRRSGSVAQTQTEDLMLGNSWQPQSVQPPLSTFAAAELQNGEVDDYYNKTYDADLYPIMELNQLSSPLVVQDNAPAAVDNVAIMLPTYSAERLVLSSDEETLHQNDEDGNHNDAYSTSGRSSSSSSSEEDETKHLRSFGENPTTNRKLPSGDYRPLSESTGSLQKL